MLSHDAAMRFAERHNEIFNGPQLEIIDEIFAPDLVDNFTLALC